MTLHLEKVQKDEKRVVLAWDNRHQNTKRRDISRPKIVVICSITESSRMWYIHVRRKNQTRAAQTGIEREGIVVQQEFPNVTKNE